MAGESARGCYFLTVSAAQEHYADVLVVFQLQGVNGAANCLDQIANMPSSTNI
jgi:hypothetical protein